MIRKIITVVVFTLSTLTIGYSQEMSKIVVNGFAEKSMIPNEVYLSFALQDQMSLGNSLMQKEAGLMDLCKKVGLAAGDIQIENISGYSDNYGGNGFVTTKNYTAKIKGLEKFNEFIDGLSQLNPTSLNITYFSHSDISKEMKMLRFEALEDARREAEELVKTLGKEIVDVVSIEDNNYQGNGNGRVFGPFSSYPSTIQQETETLNFKHINLNYSLRVTYSMK